MQYSKNGKWIISNDLYKFIICTDDACFLKLLKYHHSFNSITFVYENLDGKVKEETVPRDYFNKITVNSIENAMLRIIHGNDINDIKNPDIRQRIFEFTNYLEKNYPEKLI